jgi:hypothetical protein
MNEPVTGAPPPAVVEVTRVTPRRRPADTIDLLESLSYLMDRCFELPGGKGRFGLNSILLLVPVLGDAVATAISLFILSVGLRSHRVPRIVAARMVVNTLLDSAVSAIPVVGNVWDVWFKADSRNVRLLREYAGADLPAPSTWRHWVFVLAMAALFALVIALLITGTWLLVSALTRASA